MGGFFDDLVKHGGKPCVVKRATIMAVVVGTILVAINHGSCVCMGMFDMMCLTQSLLTYLVPYTVSTLSSVMAISSRDGSDLDPEGCSLGKNPAQE